MLYNPLNLYKLFNYYSFRENSLISRSTDKLKKNVTSHMMPWYFDRFRTKCKLPNSNVLIQYQTVIQKYHSQIWQLDRKLWPQNRWKHSICMKQSHLFIFASLLCYRRSANYLKHLSHITNQNSLINISNAVVMLGRVIGYD